MMKYSISGDTLVKLNGARTTRKNALPRLWSDIVDTGAILMAKALRDHMEMNQLICMLQTFPLKSFCLF